MNAGAVPYDLPGLLVQAGARLVGRDRADCPKCGGKRTLAYRGEVFFCHHIGCGFKGNVWTLAKSLGLARRLTPEEARAFQAARQDSRRATDWLLNRIQERRLELCRGYRSLLSIRDGASQRLKHSPDHETAWSGLELFYREWPPVCAELALLESGPVADRLDFLQASTEARSAKLAEIIRAGGLADQDGRWVEIPL